MQRASKLETYEALSSLPEQQRGEIVGGVLVTPPSPLPRHARAQRAAGRFIGGPFDDDDGLGGPGGWWILPEVDVRLGVHDIVRPDLAGWRRARLDDPADVRPIEVVPDWVCEILSPSNAAHDRVTKRRLYANYAVPYYWLIDPEARTLEALRYDGAQGGWFEVGTYDDTSVARIEPFEAIELPVGRLFSPKRG
ncbi:MAG: Uma2 family endonuclease [Myxococcales bacterium]|jgi:Uma2 family endonuclease|nr:Uma2 family endonuclease [Myxococcales bacterium]